MKNSSVLNDRDEHVRFNYTPSLGMSYDGLEPQTIKIRSQNRRKLYVSGYYGGGENKLTITNIQIARIKRIALTRIRALISIPVYNKKFSRIGVNVDGISYILNVSYDVNISNNAFLTTPLEVAQVVAALATTTIPGFSLTIQQLGPNTIKWIGTKPWAFFNTGTRNSIITSLYGLGDSKKSFVLGFPDINFLQSQSTLQTVWATTVTGYTTRYIDISSNVITQDSKIIAMGDQPGNLVKRLYLESINSHTIDRSFDEPLDWINIDERPINNIDFTLSTNLDLDKSDVTRNAVLNPITPLDVYLELELTVEG